MNAKNEKHYSNVEFLHETVKNPNIHIRGTHSYYSDAWTGSFEESVVRYLYGDEFSLNHWTPKWPIDQLYIGDYVCIAAEVIIMLGGNHTHRMDWFSIYPFNEKYTEAYQEKGDTLIQDGVWLGMRSMIMPGITIGEGAIIAANAVVTKDVPPYSIVAGSPAKIIKTRFEDEVVERIMQLKIYSFSIEKFNRLIDLICSNNIQALEEASREFDKVRTV